MNDIMFCVFVVHINICFTHKTEIHLKALHNKRTLVCNI